MPVTINNRYEERDGFFSVSSWHPEDGESRLRGRIGRDEPQWLRTILDVARVSGDLHLVPTPPPAAIMWFTTTLDDQLIAFTEDMP